MKELKKQLRKQIAQEKRRHGITELITKSAALLEKLEQHPKFASARTVLLYYSLDDEVQTHDFVEKWHRQKTVLLPVVKGDELELRIEEPTGEAFTAYEKIDLAIIPGVSFDARGNRLGRGKGYYDKLLPLLHSYNIGICYNFQVNEKLPVEPFDRRMDEVWTENGILK